MAKGEYKFWCSKDGLCLLKGWARAGLTDQQIATNMQIHVSTLYGYRNKYKEIDDALKRSKQIVDFEVENALYNNAMSGNVTAQIFWLKNRMKDKWRDKVNEPENNDDLNKVKQLLGKLSDEAKDDSIR